mmetsp:Transcript_1747/g.3700  ORF Transcript_1747/g.3700 Transcript_1747/m.3700 type:complete len:82 (+) Transcript_1747:252-497(+)
MTTSRDSTTNKRMQNTPSAYHVLLLLLVSSKCLLLLVQVDRKIRNSRGIINIPLNSNCHKEVCRSYIPFLLGDKTTMMDMG